MDLIPVVFKPLETIRADQFLKESHFDMLRSSSYCLGCILMKGGQAVTNIVDRSLKVLLPLVQYKMDKLDPRYDDMVGMKDNAASAVAKLILMHPKSMPLGSVLPLYFSALPLEIDFDESSIVYSSLIKMINTFPKEFPGMIDSHIPRMVDIMSQAIECKKIKEALRNFMAKTCSTLMNSKDHGEKLKEMVDSWPATKKQSFLSKLS